MLCSSLEPTIYGCFLLPTSLLFSQTPHFIACFPLSSCLQLFFSHICGVSHACEMGVMYNHTHAWIPSMCFLDYVRGIVLSPFISFHYLGFHVHWLAWMQNDTPKLLWYMMFLYSFECSFHLGAYKIGA